MVSRKYAGDYRLENVRNKNGKLVTKAVYRGEIFGFERPEEEVRRTRRIFLVSTVCEWVFLIAFLFINSDKGRVMYVSLPMIAAAFPLLGQSDTVGLLYRKSGEYKREEKDRVTERLVSYLFISFFFALCSAVGHTVAWIRNGESTADAVHLVLTVLFVFTAWNLFSKREALRMKSTGTTVLPETENE